MAKLQAWGIMVGGGILGTVCMINVKCVCVCLCVIMNLKDLMRRVPGQKQKEDCK